MAHSPELPGEHHSSGLTGLLKHPFHELKDLKDKLKNTTLHDAKVALNHKKSVAQCVLMGGLI